MYRNGFYDADGIRRGAKARRGRRPHSYDYEAFGKVFGTPTENLTQPFRFTGRAWDPESELYYYRARSYGAQTGRFLARDPLVLLPAYGYVANAPTAFIDPLGLILIEELNAGEVGSFGSVLGLAEQVASDNISASGAVNYGGFLSDVADWGSPANTPKYLMTSKAGLIDMPHFYTSMVGALTAKLGLEAWTDVKDPEGWASGGAVDAGLAVEVWQALTGSYSRFTREDIPSNALGAFFGAYCLDGTETPEEFLEKLEDFLKMLGPMDWSGFDDDEKGRIIDHYGVTRGMSPEEHKKREAFRADANAGDPCGVCKKGMSTEFPFKTSFPLHVAIVPPD